MEDLYNFIKENYFKHEYGIPAVTYSTTSSNSEVITDEYSLNDLALAIIVLDKLGNEIDKAYLSKKLDYFKITTEVGYYEQIDTCGCISLSGQLKTPKTQSLALFAQWLCTSKNSKEENDKYLHEIEKIIDYCIQFNWPNKLNSTYEFPIDSDSYLESVAIISIIYTQFLQKYNGEHTSTQEKYCQVIYEKLTDFLSGDIAYGLIKNGKPDISYGYTLRSNLYTAIAFINLSLLGYNDGINIARVILSHIILFKDNTNGGYWDRLDYCKKVRVDALSFLHGNLLSPFPSKNIFDHSLLVISSKKYLECKLDALIDDLKIDSLNEVMKFYDYQNGGIFQGKGSWFSTPYDATVPLARHVMVKKHQSRGSFSVGNTSYVPFHGKHIETQLISLLSLAGKNIQKPAPYTLILKPERIDLEVKLSNPAKEKLSHGIIDVQRYINWLNNTHSGFGYGLTPYPSPLALRSDKTPQTFSAVHVISDMTVLGLKIPNEEQIITGINASQNLDGGFCEQPSLLSEVFTTYCAVLTCVILNKLKFDTSKCIEFINSCQHIQGGYGNASGYPCDAWHSNLAVLSLVALKKRPLRENALVAYLIACQNKDGGYGNCPNINSDVFATFRVISSLMALGYEPPNRSLTINWLRSLQAQNGGFRFKEGAAVSFVGSYHAIAALYILGSCPINIKECINYISIRQSLDGGFSRSEKGRSETTDEGFIAIQALHMLENKLEPYWAIIVT